jgi:SpoIID/LytB domain protein
VWTPFPLGNVSSFVGPVRFSGAPLNRVGFPNGTSRDYRGVVQAVRTGPTALASVVVLDLEDYLLGVVPRESSASWRSAALEAQSIAARSYSANKRDRVAGAGQWDICDTTQCQVFGGTRLYTSTATVDLEPAATTAAVRATAGVVRTYLGKPILAEYSSSNGGWSTAGSVPYLPARKDDWDGAVPNGVHAWKATLRATDLERRFPTLGTLKRIRVTARDGNGEWGGRVRTVVLEGVSSTGAPTSVTTTGAGVYNARPWPASSDGLRSSWWKLIASVPQTSAGLRERPLFKGSGPSRVGVR